MASQGVGMLRGGNVKAAVPKKFEETTVAAVDVKQCCSPSLPVSNGLLQKMTLYAVDKEFGCVDGMNCCMHSEKGIGKKVSCFSENVYEFLS